MGLGGLVGVREELVGVGEGLVGVREGLIGVREGWGLVKVVVLAGEEDRTSCIEHY